jgi:hypothetical protein
MVAGRRRWLALGITALAASPPACGPLGIGGPENELRDRRAAWEAMGIHDYAITMQPSCYCLPEWIRTAVVVVRADTVLDVQDPNTGESLQHRYHYRTVSGLFDLIQDAFDRGAASVEVTYHETSHFPTSIAIDYEVNVADEEIGYTVWGLVMQR